MTKNIIVILSLPIEAAASANAISSAPRKKTFAEEKKLLASALESNLISYDIPNAPKNISYLDLNRYDYLEQGIDKALSKKIYSSSRRLEDGTYKRELTPFAQEFMTKLEILGRKLAQEIIQKNSTAQ